MRWRGRRYMIKMLTAHTMEMDDTDRAVQELLEQIDVSNSLCAHSVGIVTGSAEFLETDIVRVLREKVPFDIVGATTLEDGVPGEADMLMLGLSVLTSDDVMFTASWTDDLDDGVEPLAEAYKKSASSIVGEPSMVLGFFPIMYSVSAEVMLDKLEEANGGIPVFGQLACENENNASDAYTLFNGEISRKRVAMVLISGNITPRFLIEVIPEGKIQKQRAIITSSVDNVLKEVNKKPILEYMRQLGLAAGDGIEGVLSIPFMVGYEEGGQPVARAMYTVTEEGHIICGGRMPEGATLAVASIDEEGVMETADTMGRAIASMPDVNGVIMFPCLSRMGALGIRTLREINAMDAILGDIPYHISYAGGEVCPVMADSGELINRVHNFSLIAWVF